MICALALLLQIEAVEPIRKAAEKTAADGYAYSIEGRLSRTGEFRAPTLLVSHIDKLSSLRVGDAIYLKGADQTWKHADEATGKEFPTEPAKKVRALLVDARPPHEMLLELAGKAKRLVAEERTKREHVACTRYEFDLDLEKLKDEMKALVDRAVLERRIEKPDRMNWSRFKATLTCTVDGQGRLMAASDVRGVDLEYKAIGPDKVVHYETSMEFSWQSVGAAKLSVPAELLKKLDVKDK
jgi:hypothetical protein